MNLVLKGHPYPLAQGFSPRCEDVLKEGGAHYQTPTFKNTPRDASNDDVCFQILLTFHKQTIHFVELLKPFPYNQDPFMTFNSI